MNIKLEEIEKEIRQIEHKLKKTIEYKIIEALKVFCLYPTIKSQEELIEIIKYLGNLDNILEMNGYEIRIKTDNDFSANTVYWTKLSVNNENYIRVLYYR